MINNKFYNTSIVSYLIQLICMCMLCIWTNPLMAQVTDSVYKSVELPKGYTQLLNQVYTTVDGWEGKMDIYFPESAKPAPLIINIHGGGWNHGVKASQTGFNTFFKEGFVVANIEYRLTGQATAPAAVSDCRCALIYLIRNASVLHIDVNRIVVMGGSAGGHLALMTGLLANDKKFDIPCSGKEDVKVAAIIDKYGITDVWDWGYGAVIKSKSATNWLGNFAKDENFAKSVSPVSYVHSKNPPVLIVHGDADPTVSYQQSVLMKSLLDKAGVVNEMVTIPGGLHGKFTKEQNSALNASIISFLKKVKVIE